MKTTIQKYWKINLFIFLGLFIGIIYLYYNNLYENLTPKELNSQIIITQATIDIKTQNITVIGNAPAKMNLGIYYGNTLSSRIPKNFAGQCTVTDTGNFICTFKYNKNLNINNLPNNISLIIFGLFEPSLPTLPKGIPRRSNYPSIIQYPYGNNTIGTTVNIPVPTTNSAKQLVF